MEPKKRYLSVSQASTWAEIWVIARECGLSFDEAQQIADDLCRELPALDRGAGSINPVGAVVEIRDACGGVEVHCA